MTIETSLAISILLQTKAAEAFHVVEMVQFSIHHDEGYAIRRVIARLMGIHNGYPGEKNISLNDFLDSRSQPETVAFPSGAATEAHTAQLSPRAEVEAIQADAARIAQIREEMEAEDGYDPEAMYDRRGRLVAEDPDADYDAECKYAEVD